MLLFSNSSGLKPRSVLAEGDIVYPVEPGGEVGQQKAEWNVVETYLQVNKCVTSVSQWLSKWRLYKETVEKAQSAGAGLDMTVYLPRDSEQLEQEIQELQTWFNSTFPNSTFPPDLSQIQQEVEYFEEMDDYSVHQLADMRNNYIKSPTEKLLGTSVCCSATDVLKFMDRQVGLETDIPVARRLFSD